MGWLDGGGGADGWGGGGGGSISDYFCFERINLIFCGH